MLLTVILKFDKKAILQTVGWRVVKVSSGKSHCRTTAYAITFGTFNTINIFFEVD